MIYEIITLALLAVWLTGWFTPLNFFREVITEWWVKTTIKMGLPAMASFAVVLSCSKCMGFWLTLFWKQDFFLALSVSAVAFVITFGIEQIEKYR